MTDVIQVVTTTADKTGAEKIAGALVEQRLAACVQITGPVTSTFRWQGKIETCDEWLCTAKTRRDLYSQVETAIRALHGYDEPEILALPVVDGSTGYINWLNSEVVPLAEDV